MVPGIGFSNMKAGKAQPTTMPTYISALQITSGGLTSKTATGYYPADLQAGDIAIFSFCINKYNTEDDPYVESITDSYGGDFNLIYTTEISNDYYAYHYWKRCNGSEAGGTCTITLNQSTPYGAYPLYGAVIIFRGCATTGSPIGNYSQIATTSGTSGSLSGQTTTLNNSLGVSVYLQYDNIAITPTLNSWTGRYSNSTTSAQDSLIYVATEGKATPGTLSTISYSWSGTEYYQVQYIELIGS